MQKYVALVLTTILALSSIIIVRPVCSEITKPSVPEFTLKYFDRSYDVLPTYGIDPYTGKTVITREGYHVDNRTVEFTIKNQPFTAYTDTNGNFNTIYYNFRFKGQYGNAWIYYPFAGEYTTHTWGYYTTGNLSPMYPASDSSYTVITIELSTLTIYPAGTQPIPDGSKIDFQMQSLMGYINPTDSGMLAGSYFKFTGESSDWSNAQSLVISNSSSTANSGTTPNSTGPQQIDTQSGILLGLDWEQITMILGIIVVTLTLALVFSHRSSTKHTQAPSNIAVPQ